MLYTDPGSGVMLWQILAAGAVGALFYVRKIFTFFRGAPQPQASQENGQESNAVPK